MPRVNVDAGPSTSDEVVAISVDESPQSMEREIDEDSPKGKKKPEPPEEPTRTARTASDALIAATRDANNSVAQSKAQNEIATIFGTDGPR